MKLSTTQKEVLRLLTEQFCTVREICKKRGCTHQAVYKIVQQLYAKGAMNRDKWKRLHNSRSTPSRPLRSNNKQILRWRLHGMEWNFQILRSTPFYTRIRKKNTFQYDGHTIRLYKESLEIYMGEGNEFIGDTPTRAFSQAMTYWNRFFVKLESHLRITLVKDKYQNYGLVNWHFAQPGNEIAEQMNEKKERIRLYAEEDGKLWFTIDGSWNLDELEALHPETALPDAKLLDTVMNDWRSRRVPIPREMAGYITQLTQIQKKEVEKWGLYATHIEAHTESVIEMAASQKKNTHAINKFIAMLDILHTNLNKLLEKKNK